MAPERRVTVTARGKVPQDGTLVVPDLPPFAGVLDGRGDSFLDGIPVLELLGRRDLSQKGSKSGQSPPRTFLSSRTC